MLVKFLFVCGMLLVSNFGSFAQTTDQPFIKISHLGTEGRPITDLYLATQEPALSPENGLTGRYKFESVCLLTEAEFAPLLHYAEGFLAKTKRDGKNMKYGTFEITLGPNAATHQGIYARSKSLTFLNAAVQVLQQHAADADTNEALHRLRITIRRLSAGNP